VATADTRIGSAGSSSASRQTYCTGGAVREACAAVRDEVLLLCAERHGHRWPALLARPSDFRLDGGRVVAPDGRPVAAVADLVAGEPVEETREFHHRPTSPLDPETGQGEAHLQYAFAAHRAVVDVDVELGLVRVVEIATAQDVGRAVNPQAVEGQLEGGAAQGLGLALMEEMRLERGVVRNPSFTDYLIPTILDVPRVHAEILQLGDPISPYGAKGVGEPPAISSTPAIVAAVRAATGRPLTRVPIRPDEIARP
jgi:CO/xanthine dehydrogenase Mo-binding subunit